jgi:lycopene beta-cyclase
MRQHFDIAIVGGGLAGLSLAARLAAPEFSHWRIALFEPRDVYVRDRTWSSWAVAEHAFSRARAAHWPRWEVMRQLDAEDSTGIARTLPAMTACAGTYAYEMVPADNFYAAATETIARAGHVSVLRGMNVTAIDADPAVERGKAVLRARHEGGAGAGEEMLYAGSLVFDSRPPKTLSNAAWIQHFRGGEVETDEAVFDTSCATVMDFSVMTAADALAGRVHFIYVLPISPTRALVQDTFFVPAQRYPEAVDYESNIRAYLHRRFGVDRYRIAYPEGGAIPMDPALLPSTARAAVLKIGTGGGMARASSGYAFFETQRACEAIAHSLLRESSLDNGFRLPRWRSAMSYWMDGVFLRVLRAQPALAPHIFAGLFCRVPSDALARFLAGVGSRQDVLRVMMACPKWPFIRAALAR